MTAEGDRERLRSLSARERDCLRLVLENYSSKEIGRRLEISHTSVDTHVRRALAKLGLRDRYAAAELLARWETEEASATAAPPPSPRTGLLPPMEDLGPWSRIGLVIACAVLIAVTFGVVLTALQAF